MPGPISNLCGGYRTNTHSPRCGKGDRPKRHGHRAGEKGGAALLKMRSSGNPKIGVPATGQIKLQGKSYGNSDGE